MISIFFNWNSIMFSKATPGLAKHTKRMALLQNNAEPIFLLQPDNLIQGGNLAGILVDGLYNNVASNLFRTFISMSKFFQSACK
uniref:Uncharacterized protein n=1 Tax=Arundo donax TaxID=35708 RepID=A0A0A9ACU8_ARUDO